MSEEFKTVFVVDHAGQKWVGLDDYTKLIQENVRLTNELSDLRSKLRLTKEDLHQHEIMRVGLFRRGRS